MSLSVSVYRLTTFAAVVLLGGCLGWADPSSKVRSGAAMGPLRVHPTNGRYFVDGTGKAVYLTGSHTWTALVDRGLTDPPPIFDFTAYLDFLQSHNHNFIRLWSQQLFMENHRDGTTERAEPFPWPRTGGGSAWDGKPKFDLSTFNEDYFTRLRDRVAAARDRGIYVSIMLFKGEDAPNSGLGHPFHSSNNINGINGDPNGDGLVLETFTLQIPAIVAIQKAYIAKVIETVNHLDNVLYEICNEIGNYSTAWQYEMITFVKDTEAGKTQQHPVGMTFQWSNYGRGTNVALFNSPADWVSPGDDDTGDYANLLPANGRKVILLDTDHLSVNNINDPNGGADQAWVWKSFLRGYNPILMDAPGDPRIAGDLAKARIESARRAMGQTLSYATKVDLTTMAPRGDLSSTSYCLANPSSQAEYLVYQPSGGSFSVNLAAGTYAYEWFSSDAGAVASTGSITVRGGNTSFTPPFGGEAMLYLKSHTVQTKLEPTSIQIDSQTDEVLLGNQMNFSASAPHEWSETIYRVGMESKWRSGRETA
jgi:hypothetical protein